MKKILVTLCVIVLSVGVARAQTYNYAVGVKTGGMSTGLNFKMFLDPMNALEFQLAVPYNRGSTLDVAATYQRHFPVIADGFNLFFGGGAHIGQWSSYHDRGEFTLGIVGLIGLEYKIPTVPLAVFIDFRPTLNIVGHKVLPMEDLSLGMRFTF